MKRTIRIRKAILTVAAFAACAQVAFAQQSLTYPDLVKRMTDMEHLAVLPEPGEEWPQWSSYDRASRYDEATGKYIKWDANADGHHIIREEGKLSVIAEMEGPGCIWRIWSALAEKGHVKIYLDGREEPVVDLPLVDYFTGKTAPFDYPTLSYQLADVDSRGHNLYLPIPYQKSCKIVAEEGWGRYYQFVYTTFPKGTKVPTFQADLPAEDAATLRQLDGFFREKLGTDPAGRRDGQATIARKIVLPAGTTEKFQLNGPRAITAIKVKTDFNNREEEMAALRELVLKITFDGQPDPAVWCPLGDFFGTAPGVNLYKCLATGMTDQGAYAYWYMPFAGNAVVELVNQGRLTRRLDAEIVHARLSRPFEGMGHFHCKWHRDIFPLTPDRAPDWGILRAKGRGRFCGLTLHVWDPLGGWWGEGDEKFFVDGEKFPSTIGTGSEDYFGYAWGDPTLFQFPYHCQTMTEDNHGHQSLLRWHIADNVPFQESFEACIEKYYLNSRGTLYACATCFYLAPDGSDPIGSTPLSERHGYYVSPPVRGGGYEVLGKRPPGMVRTQIMAGYEGGKWDNGDQLWWTGAKPDDKLDVLLKVEKSGTYEVVVKLTKAADYGIVQLYVDDKKAGDPIDLYNDGVIPSGPIAIGSHRMDKGDHKLTVQIVGANQKAVKGYMFGLDRIILNAVK